MIFGNTGRNVVRSLFFVYIGDVQQSGSVSLSLRCRFAKTLNPLSGSYPMTSFFQLKWLRKLVRRNTKPIEYGSALAWRDRLSIGYAILAWNAFGMVCYMVYTGRNDWAKHHGLKSEEELSMSPGKWVYLEYFRGSDYITKHGCLPINSPTIRSHA